MFQLLLYHKTSHMALFCNNIHLCVQLISIQVVLIRALFVSQSLKCLCYVYMLNRCYFCMNSTYFLEFAPNSLTMTKQIIIFFNLDT